MVALPALHYRLQMLIEKWAAQCGVTGYQDFRLS